MTHAYGGDVETTLNGAPHTLTEMPTFEVDRFEKSEQVNGDGSVDVTYAPSAGTVPVTFRDRGENWADVANGGPYVVSIVERHAGASHVVNNARFTGKVSINRQSGEVSGLTLVFNPRDYLRRG